MGLVAEWQGWTDRRALRRAAPALGLTIEPEPDTVGLFARGRQIAAGSFHLAGHTLETHDPWLAEAPSPDFAAELHGWGWLDHLAAFGDAAARAEARRWLDDWITRFGRGSGPGWQPDLAGRRTLRWLMHSLFLTAGAQAGAAGRYLDALGGHAAFLARSHARAPAGLPRIEAQTGWLHAALMLRGLEDQAAPALAALTDSAAQLIGPDGGLAGRNPEDLLMVFAHLGWCRQLLFRLDRPLPERLAGAIIRAARALRTLRHADGGLARFHGGGAGPEGLLDRMLSLVAADGGARPLAAMGFARLEGGRTTVIVDAAAPPGGAAATRAQASTLGFELTSGRRPLIVGCGPGREFGREWEQAARATSSHSTLGLDGVSSSRFARVGRRRRSHGSALREGPHHVTLHRSDERDMSGLILSHDGWVPTHGLTHSRTLELSADGRTLLGSDTLDTLGRDDQQRLARVLAGLGGRGIGLAVRFHLHPDADASLDMNGRAVSVGLPSGEVWVFRFDGPATLTLDPSVWLEPGRRAPRPCRQIVLRAALSGRAVRINWTLAKAQATPLAIRDIGRDDDAALPHDFFDRD